MLDVDWAAHWKGLVEAREAQIGPPTGGDWWAPRASQRVFSLRDQPEWLLGFLEPWLSPARTLLDVGAGTGRHTGPLSLRLDWVTAVEPSGAMREHIPAAENVTVIGSTWEDAEPAPSDLVLCAHVIYPVADVVPFIEKLERHARERVFIALRDSRSVHPAETMAGPGRAREPRLRDCFLLLRQLGIAPDVALHTHAAFHRFESLERAVEDCRGRVGRAWDEAAGRAWLEAHLVADEDGSLRYDAGEATTGVLHWKPRT